MFKKLHLTPPPTLRFGLSSGPLINLRTPPPDNYCTVPKDFSPRDDFNGLALILYTSLNQFFGRKWKEKFLRKYPVILVIARKGKGNQLQSCSEARFSFLNAKPAKKQTNKHKENTSLQKHSVTLTCCLE